MADPLRTFIAVSMPRNNELARVIRSLGEMGSALKPVSSDNLHITLKFLGDTPQVHVADISAILQKATAGTDSFEMELLGLGAFPRIERPAVVWAGVEGGEPLIQIAGRLDVELNELGYPRERRSFTPHLTIARVRRKPPQELFDLFDRHTATRFGSVPVETVKLYQSELRPEGSVYSVLSEAALSAL